jgi:hypothetical protein
MNRHTEVRWVQSAVVVALGIILSLVMTSCSGSSPTEPTTDESGGFVFDEDGKIAICHYQQDIGTWTLVKLSLEATLEHLDKHDDAVPGGVTAITKTQLDSNCKKVE